MKVISLAIQHIPTITKRELCDKTEALREIEDLLRICQEIEEVEADQWNFNEETPELRDRIKGEQEDLETRELKIQKLKTVLHLAMTFIQTQIPLIL